MARLHFLPSSPTASLAGFLDLVARMESQRILYRATHSLPEMAKMAVQINFMGSAAFLGALLPPLQDLRDYHARLG
jgi:hypothetical protein